MPIESLTNLSSLRVPELSKYQSYSDVPKADATQRLLSQSPELKAFRSALKTHEKLLEAAKTAESKDESEALMTATKMLDTESHRLEIGLKRRVLYEKQMQVYRDGVTRLETRF